MDEYEGQKDGEDLPSGAIYDVLLSVPTTLDTKVSGVEHYFRQLIQQSS